MAKIFGQYDGTLCKQDAYRELCGVVFTLSYCKSGNLLPYILAHSFIDVSSVFASDEGSQVPDMILRIAFIVIARCIYPVKRVPTPAIRRTDLQKEQAPGPQEP